MGPYEVDYTALILNVLKDWRVLVILAGFFLVAALLRYVGVVFHSATPRPRAPKKLLRQAKARSPSSTAVDEGSEL